MFLEQLSPPSIGHVLVVSTSALLLCSAGERFPDLLLCVKRLRLCPCHTELVVDTGNSIFFRSTFFDDHTSQSVTNDASKQALIRCTSRPDQVP